MISMISMNGLSLLKVGRGESEFSGEGCKEGVKVWPMITD